MKLALKNIFDQLEFESDEAFSGEIALELVKARHESGKAMYELILIDETIQNCNVCQVIVWIKNYLKQFNPPKLPYIGCMTSNSNIHTIKDVA